MASARRIKAAEHTRGLIEKILGSGDDSTATKALLLLKDKQKLDKLVSQIEWLNSGAVLGDDGKIPSLYNKA